MASRKWEKVNTVVGVTLSLSSLYVHTLFLQYEFNFDNLFLFRLTAAENLKYRVELDYDNSYMLTEVRFYQRKA